MHIQFGFRNLRRLLGEIAWYLRKLRYRTASSPLQRGPVHSLADTRQTSAWRPGWQEGLLGILLSGLMMGPTWAQSGAALRERHAALQADLRQNQFQQPLHLSSTQAPEGLKGDVFAVVEHPFSAVREAFQARENWCEVLILHLNVKQCLVNSNDMITVNVGKKFNQPLRDTYRIDFNYRLAATSGDHLQVELKAAEGPMGTRDYRIVLEATPLDVKRSFIHMAYSYGYGMAARMAMQVYLATVGSSKVGFSVIGRTPDGQPVHVGNVRGVVERNTMRYYLAIEAYLGARQVPPTKQLAKRLHDWFAATERYKRQLHELDEAEYIDMKLKEVQRQQRP